ncbi:MAG: UvrD-helicase domain-containing protein [Gammaproteobacteria bacterium]|nr:MAG: UvrD-helicase domain-containing protein [Gammaproteobacteria bacterium]
MSRPADWNDRQLGRDLTHSYIVQAPAGSGKTELLIQRVLSLLSQVENPEEVVAITFTRKAAAEMSHRLVGRLQAAAGDPDKVGLRPHEQVSHDLALAVLKNAAARDWNLLEQPSRLRIRTIDSLSSELARQLPVLSGLGGDQQTAVDANADALYHKAAARTLAVIEDGSDALQADVIRVLDRYDNQYDKLVGLLTGMLANREQWIGHLLDVRQGDGFDRQGLEEALRYLIEIQLQKARQLTPDDLLCSLPRLYNFALSHAPTDEPQLKALMDACGGFDCNSLDLPANADSLPHWQTMINRFLTKKGEKWLAAPNKNHGFPAPKKAKGDDIATFADAKAEFTALLDKHRENDELRNIYHTIRSLPQPDYEDEAWESLESLMRILLRAATEWDVVMAETGEVDFGEVAYRAIQSLGYEDAPTDLALRMDYRIQHLLVDEFQDTSQNQVRLLEKLTTGWSDGDGRTLFLVGDPMQSIYRFRKAEVSLFIKAWQGKLFEHIQLLPLQLTVNFRSSTPIVDWVNKTFPVVMPRENDPVMGAVSYSAAGTRPGVSDEGTVAIKILPERDDEKEAGQVIEVIQQCDPSETVAILVRSRPHASAILAALDRLKQDEPKYRYQAIKFTKLANTTLIQDLVSLTLALLQPADRLAWLATLRAPCIGLDLADLDALVAGDAGNILLDAIAAYGNGEGAQSPLSKNGRDRLQRTAPILLAAVNQRGRQPIRSLVESTWISLGGPACVENNSELSDAATYFDLLDSLEAENLPIDRDTLDLRMQKLFAEPDADAAGNLLVMTIYEAKGLQFDTVILPGLNRKPRGDESKLLHWFELAGEDKIVMSPMRNTHEKDKQKKSGDLIQYITDIEKDRQSLEHGRLLYVAATRAIRNLHLLAAVKPSARGLIKATASSLMSQLWPAIQDEQTPLLQQATENLEPAEAEDAEDTDVDEETVSRSLNLPLDYRRLKENWKLPAPPESVQTARSDPADTQDYIEFSWAGEDARLTGNLVHRLLQLIGELGLDSWEAGGGISSRAQWCRQQLASAGVQEEKADAIIARASEAIDNCLASEQGRWILENHADARCEYAITAVLEDQPKNLVLDRTFFENGTRWIIDYKTSSHSGGDLEGFLENEATRYAEQLQRYKNAMSITETRPIRTALYFPLLDRFCELE